VLNESAAWLPGLPLAAALQGALSVKTVELFGLPVFVPVTFLKIPDARA